MKISFRQRPAVRLTAVLLCVFLLAGLLPASAEEAPAADRTYEITEGTFRIYSLDPEQSPDDVLTLYFADGAEDFPFVDLRDWCGFMTEVFSEDLRYSGYQLTATVDEASGIVMLRRENGSSMTCIFPDREIVFDDYNAYRKDNTGLYINMAWVEKSDPEQVNVLGVTGSRERLGKSLSLELGAYGIPMIAQDGKYLLPLQTLSYLHLSIINAAVFFNRKELILCGAGQIRNPDREMVSALYSKGLLTDELWKEAKGKTASYPERVAYVLEEISQDEEGKNFIEAQKEQTRGSLSELYYSGPRGKRSEALAAYGYGELCMELDNEYGLQDAHNIKGFAEYFEQTGLTERLFDPDASVADSAIGEMTDFWMDDGHSAYLSNSYLADYAGDSWNSGYDQQRMEKLGQAVSEIRGKYENAAEPYYETGDTAYITFDEFTLDPSVHAFSAYYELYEQDRLPDDSFSLILWAHRKITRENSPIRNVVLDLSCNEGGATCAGVFALCWFLGEAQLSVTNPLTGAESTVSFKADINMDHRYDEKDSLSHLNLYCLISPNSFSCANLVPWAFTAAGRVTLLGKTSGGGSCVVRQLTTSWGSSYSVSGSERISFVKNGAYYDVDQGVEPDVFIRDYNSFYDREALTEIIHSLR